MGSDGQVGLLERFRRGTDLNGAEAELAVLEETSSYDTGELLARIVLYLSLPSVLFFICSGAVLRAYQVVPRDAADGIRKTCFTVLLPAFLLRHIWEANLETEHYGIAAWSFVSHGAWFALSLRVGGYLQPKSQDFALRGWSMLMTQGTMNSFLYPLLLRHPRFGTQALACAVLWDVGGNMWICQLALFAIAAYHSPFSRPHQHDDSGDIFDSETHGLKPGSSGLKRFLDEMLPQKVLVDALRQPVLIACILGFLLNFASAPLPMAVDTVLSVLGEPYKLVLYFIVGYYGDFQFQAGDLVLLGRTIAARYSIVLAMMCFVMKLPLTLVYRQTICLVVLSPSSSYLIHLVSEHGYGENLLRLTVCGAFLTTLISTFSQHLLIAAFESWPS